MLELKNEITCLHCWAKFAPEDVLWQTEHRELLGDPIVGQNAQLRFLPNRFDLQGHAIDACGQTCREIACPNCHLSLPRSLLQRNPLFVSILGTPSCGKSYYLAALVASLRRTLPAQFKVDISDADTVSNLSLIEYEEHLFLNKTPDDYVALGDLIPKTQLGGTLYNAVTFGNQEIRFPRPFSFLLEPSTAHPNRGQYDHLKRVLCLYDNAGEHFLPGADSRSAPGTRHMAESSYLLFVFDPTQDPRWYSALRKADPESNLRLTDGGGRQEGVLREIALRIRNLRCLADGEKYNRPLIVVVNKVDVWKKMLGSGNWSLPFRKNSQGVFSIDTSLVLDQSQRLRKLLMKHIPELVYSAESFCERVFYLPASALGTSPKFDDQGKGFIRPKQIQPTLVTVPFLLGLSLVTTGLVSKTAEPIP